MGFHHTLPFHSRLLKMPIQPVSVAVGRGKADVRQGAEILWRQNGFGAERMVGLQYTNFIEGHQGCAAGACWRRRVLRQAQIKSLGGKATPPAAAIPAG